MPAPYPAPREGQVVDRGVSGFPMFFSQHTDRIVTADPLALFEHLASTGLPSAQRAEALAYIAQAADFYEAAPSPHLSSKPPLYYYSFMNLVKVLLALKGTSIPPAVRHGISDPRANLRERFRLEGQSIHMTGRAHDRSELFPELVEALGGTVTGPRSIKVLRLLAQIPAIHRTFTRTTGEKPLLVPVKRIELRRKHARVWARIVMQINNEQVRETFRIIRQRTYFRNALGQVRSEAQGESWFETDDLNCKGKAANPSMVALARQLKSLRLSAILSDDGYKYYLSAVRATDFLPPLAASFASIFYLGSITRYKPADFDKLRAGKYGWICEELLASQPTQLVYGMASEAAGVDVVRPWSVIA